MVSGTAFAAVAHRRKVLQQAKTPDDRLQVPSARVGRARRMSAVVVLEQQQEVVRSWCWVQRRPVPEMQTSTAASPPTEQLGPHALQTIVEAAHSDRRRAQR